MILRATTFLLFFSILKRSKAERRTFGIHQERQQRMKAGQRRRRNVPLVNLTKRALADSLVLDEEFLWVCCFWAGLCAVSEAAMPNETYHLRGVSKKCTFYALYP
jgi:hypothetical protein